MLQRNYLVKSFAVLLWLNGSNIFSVWLIDNGFDWFFPIEALILLLGTEVVLGLDLTALDWTFCRCISWADDFLVLLGWGLTILGLNGLACLGAALGDLAFWASSCFCSCACFAMACQTLSVISFHNSICDSASATQTHALTSTKPAFNPIVMFKSMDSDSCQKSLMIWSSRWLSKMHNI